MILNKKVEGVDLTEHPLRRFRGLRGLLGAMQGTGKHNHGVEKAGSLSLKKRN